jgi:hypothetical protein
VNSNSAIARPKCAKVIGAPARTSSNTRPNSVRYGADALRRTSTASRRSKLVPGTAKPAASVRSVGGMNAWAVSRWARLESVRLSGAGKSKPAVLSNGSPESARKREFHISVG